MKTYSADFFSKPSNPSHKMYEALRSIYVDNIPKEKVAEDTGYAINTLNILIYRFKKGELYFFENKTPGPKERRVDNNIKEKIIALRKMNKSCESIFEDIDKKVSLRTIQRIVNEEGFTRLPTSGRKRKSRMPNPLTPQRSSRIDWNTADEMEIPCQVAGIFLLVPYLLDLEFNDLIKHSNLPGTSEITNINYALSILALKFIGKERLSHITDYNFDNGIGLFAGLNVLPKTTCTTTYTYGINKQMTTELMKAFVKNVDRISEDNYPSKTINLDFHTIPHYGDNENINMEKNWAGAKNKLLRGALTFVVQDSDSKMLNYMNADIKKEDASREIMNFVDYWIDVKGVLNGTLVFDSKLTKYDCLNELDQQGIKFITLRRRGKTLIENAINIPSEKWEDIKLKIPKRKYNEFRVYESDVPLRGYERSVRQIIIRDHGRAEPTFVVTNNRDMTIEEILTVYAKRWRIENKIDELIQFFSLNALNSPIMIRIFFDVLFTMMADCVYRLFAQDLKGFEQWTPKRLFAKFIDTTGTVKITHTQIIVKLRRKAHTPIIKSIDHFSRPHIVEWLGNRELVFEWTN